MGDFQPKKCIFGSTMFVKKFYYRLKFRKRNFVLPSASTQVVTLVRSIQLLIISWTYQYLGHRYRYLVTVAYCISADFHNKQTWSLFLNRLIG